MTNITSEPNSKIQVLNAPIELPGVCAICGSSRTDDRVYIDIGFFIEWHGQIYFCTLCMDQVANTIGYVKAEELHGYQHTAIVYQEAYERSQAKEKLCNEFIRNALSLNHGEPVTVGSVVSAIVDDPEFEKLFANISDSDSESESDNQSTEQLNSSERSNDVSSSSSSKHSFEL